METSFRDTVFLLRSALAPYDFNRAVGMNRDTFGNASHEEVVQAAAAVRAKYDEIGRPGLG